MNSLVKSSLLLHVCCGPCSISPLLVLNRSFHVTGYFYNPNIFPWKEYSLRLKYTKDWFNKNNIPLIVDKYEHRNWLNYIHLHENEPEGGKRCALCFEIRIFKTAFLAHHLGFSCFSTTLTTGPNKPAKIIFPIGFAASQKYNVSFIDIDFKKKDGFKKSCLISKKEGMYRQNYCGCEFSIFSPRISPLPKSI